VIAVRAIRCGLREYRTRRQSDGRAKQRGDDSILLHLLPLESCEGMISMPGLYAMNRKNDVSMCKQRLPLITRERAFNT
jgi:hypothetical protein